MDTNKIYKIGFLSFVKPGILTFITTSIFVILYLPLIQHTKNTEKQLFAVLVFGIWILITVIPPIILQINYYLIDKNKYIKIDTSQRRIVCFNGNVTRKIYYSQIERIEKYHSKRKGSPKMNWHTYFYYKILIKDEKPIYFSRMIIDKLDLEVKIIEIWVPFPLIKK